ncbi:uncharacterized protein NECHADRAFT_82144 [Fusarium vanettenii 77-13-4]|uniref:Zn(2)-C6 fungal-type domain-containing protein n=1 Tax=Fusarium vanettenii (strain ATCC MYA-4622 / CBS 123669 / FGSC 9596 / NRRL 45880 / 77-13-4) TaxID=660122 RepID=C7ZAM0_FUSV7|nr:uncharacterized protein NECHADRAFT_82144 [Fusarium vanettenii 77-13-4]EEU39701.1 hypothetical protein NECHADRAFT_82144 [Fusarium vanettenii 77-13-4]
MSSQDQDKSGRPGRKTRNRASKACLVCRRRKVRCNVSIVGKPCLNCALDNEACHIPEKESYRFAPPKRRVSKTSEPATFKIIRENENPGNQPSNSQPPDYDANSTHDPQTTSTSQHIDDSASMASCEDNVKYGKPPQGDSYVFTPPPRQFDDSGPFGQSTPQRRVFAAEVPYSAYSFVVVSNLPDMLPEDINFLELKGCLRIPARKHLDEFVKQYFRYVHPFLPLINEAVFWEMYYGTSQGLGPKMPLLVFQSMIFAASAHVSSETLESLGFSSTRVARRILYQRAKVLYDLESESSRLHIAQAALLISYWSPPFAKAASRPNTTWLSIAIENAKSVKAHLAGLDSAVIKDESLEQRRCLLKRLWGCCIVRDSTLSIALRRSCQIAAADRDAEVKLALKYADLETELYQSEVYDAPTKKYLIMAFLHLAELCRRMAHVSKLLFPFENGAPEDAILASTTDDKQIIGTFKYFLSGWCDTAKLWLQCPSPADKPKPVNTHSRYPERTNWDQLVSPAHIHHRIACSALPLALHMINGRLNGSFQDSRLLVLFQAMRTYEYLYDGVEWVAETIKLIMGQKQLAHLLESALPGTSLGSSSWESCLASNPTCYLRVTVTMDLSFSQGRLPEEKDFPARLRDIEEKPIPAPLLKGNLTTASSQPEHPARDPPAAETATLETTLARPLGLAPGSDLAKAPNEGDSMDDLLSLEGLDVVMEQSLDFPEMCLSTCDDRALDSFLTSHANEGLMENVGDETLSTEILDKFDWF